MTTTERRAQSEAMVMTERVFARNLRAFVDTYRALGAGADVDVLEVAGGVAAFVGIGSPLTTAKGIAASVERGVSEGSLGPGAALPPVRRLADELMVSPGTVATAYKELRQRGIVVTRGRGGTVVAAAPAVASRRPPKVPDGLRDLAGGHPDPELLPRLVTPSRLSPGARSHRATPRLITESARRS